MSGNIYGTGLTGLLKKGWHQIPGVMGGLVMAGLGVGIAIYSIKTHYKNGPWDPKYKLDYIVVRPDDPKPKTSAEDW